MAPILEIRIGHSPKPLYVSLDVPDVLSLIQMQAGPADVMILVVWVHPDGSRLKECALRCGTMGWSQAMSTIPDREGNSASKLEHIVVIPRERPLFGYEPMKYYFSIEQFPRWQHS